MQMTDTCAGAPGAHPWPACTHCHCATQTQLPLLLPLLSYSCCCQVVLGASLDEALAWAQAEGNLPSDVAGLVKQALAAKGQPFNGTPTHAAVMSALHRLHGANAGAPGCVHAAALRALPLTL